MAACRLNLHLGVCVIGKPSPPKAPDPTATIAAQSAANSQSALQTAELNRINQYTPYGNLTYSTSGTYPDGTPIYSQTETLAPAQQQLLELGNQGALGLGNTAVNMLGQVSSAYANPLDYSGQPGIASTVNNGQTTADAIKQAQDAAYRSQTQYLDPRFAQQQSALDNSLINQGITQGSEAYNNAQRQFNDQRNLAYQSAQDAATQAGFGEQATLYGQGLSSAQLQNQAQQQYLSQLYAKQNQPLNAYNALITGAQVQQPSFSGVPQNNVATTNAGGIINDAYQNRLAQYQAQMAGMNNLFSLAGSLGSAAIISDRRLKRDVRRVGETASGIPIYDFRYLDHDTVYRGVMADEVLHIPGAAIMGEDGFYRVDYSRVR